jgi:hypothetical protein
MSKLKSALGLPMISSLCFIVFFASFKPLDICELPFEEKQKTPNYPLLLLPSPKGNYILAHGKVRIGSGAPSPAPSSTPILTLVSEEISVLHIVYADSGAPNTHYKPANVAFCEICYKVGDPTPATIAECTERYNISRSHEGMVFTPQQRGKNIYTYGRWVNKNGKLGPWSNLVSAIIP